MLSASLLRASRSARARQMTTALPATRKVVARFVAGENDSDALAATQSLVAAGLLVSIDRLGEDVVDQHQAHQTADAYVQLLRRAANIGLGRSVEVSIKLSALGQALKADGDAIALDNVRRVCQGAALHGSSVNVDMEDHTTTDSTLRIVDEVRRDFPSLGAVVQSMLRRSERDCVALATPGSRVRLVKGAYREPTSVAFQTKGDVDRAYQRCLRVLIHGGSYPMIATHDTRMIRYALSRLQEAGRETSGYEFQMLYGIRTDEQRRLSELGHRMRIYVPYGDDWYAYFMRRLAERPANVGFFLRALVRQ